MQDISLHLTNSLLFFAHSSVRRLGEEDDGDIEGAAAWVAKMRQLQKEKDQAAKRVCGGCVVCVCVGGGGGSDTCRVGKVSKPLEKH